MASALELSPDAIDAGAREDHIELDKFCLGGRSGEAPIDEKRVGVEEINEIGTGHQHVPHGTEEGLKVGAGFNAVVEQRLFTGNRSFGPKAEGDFDVSAAFGLIGVVGKDSREERTARKQQGFGNELWRGVSGIEISEKTPHSACGKDPVEFEDAGGDRLRVLVRKVLQVF